MKSTVELLEMYKEEKALVIGGLNERTGLEDFPSFAEWKEEYVTDYLRTHKDVSEEEADAIFDAMADEAEAELEGVDFEDESSAEKDDEEFEPCDPPVRIEKPKTKVKAKATTKKRKATKKTSAKKPAAKKPARTSAKKPTAKKTSTPRAKSKTAQAQKIFDRFYGKKTRAEIIDKFVNQCGLTANGASTYYQKFKKAA